MALSVEPCVGDTPGPDAKNSLRGAVPEAPPEVPK